LDYSIFDDKILIELIAQKSSDALTELHRRYSRLLFSLAFNIVGDQAWAEEITLDVFMRVWEKADTYQVDLAKVNTWLTRITRNRAIDVLRQHHTKLSQQTISWAEVTDQVVEFHNTPEQAAELTMAREQIRHAVAQLPPEQQQPLLLAYLKGYSHSQIAAELGQPLGTVKTRLRQAMKKLRQILQGVDKSN